MHERETSELSVPLVEQRWLACIVTQEGLRLFIRGLTPKYTTTTDRGAASKFTSEQHALRMGQRLCPRGGRYGAEPADDRATSLS